MTEDHRLPAVALGLHAMPLLGLGTWPIPDDEVTGVVQVALEAGYRHLDTATRYRNEAGIGRALAAAAVPRADVFLTTKLPGDRVGRERETLEQSLAALRVDRVDLWLVHWPPGGRAAPEVWEEFGRAQQDGLATSVGVSNYSLDQVDELVRATGLTPAVNQVEWGPARHDPAVVAGHAERGIVLEGYSPLRSTDLAAPVLREVAAAHGCTPAQVVLAWHVAHGIVVIPRSARPERIRSNAEAVWIPLTAAEVEAVDGLSAVVAVR